jgi:hypothetical protein
MDRTIDSIARQATISSIATFLGEVFAHPSHFPPQWAEPTVWRHCHYDLPCPQLSFHVSSLRKCQNPRSYFISLSNATSVPEAGAPPRLVLRRWQNPRDRVFSSCSFRRRVSRGELRGASGWFSIGGLPTRVQPSRSSRHSFLSPQTLPRCQPSHTSLAYLTRPVKTGCYAPWGS